MNVYSSIDSVAYLIQNYIIKYRSWKYWHAQIINAQILVIVVVYTIYLEVVKGNLDEEWKLEEPVEFWKFCGRLSIQML